MKIPHLFEHVFLLCVKYLMALAIGSHCSAHVDVSIILAAVKFGHAHVYANLVCCALLDGITVGPIDLFNQEDASRAQQVERGGAEKTQPLLQGQQVSQPDR